MGITCAWCVLIIFEYLPRTRVRNFQPGFSFSSGTVPLRGLSGSLVLAAAALFVAATACDLRRRALFVAGGWEPRGLLFRRCVWSNEFGV